MDVLTRGWKNDPENTVGTDVLVVEESQSAALNPTNSSHSVPPGPRASGKGARKDLWESWIQFCTRAASSTCVICCDLSKPPQYEFRNCQHKRRAEPACPSNTFNINVPHSSR